METPCYLTQHKESIRRETSPNSYSRLKPVIVRSFRDDTLFVDTELVLHSHSGQVIDIDSRGFIDIENLGLAPWW